MPAYAAIGSGALERVEHLSVRSGVRLVSTPRRAFILLVAGRIRSEDREALRRVHDQLPHPRATLWWGTTFVEELERPVWLSAEEDPLPRMRDLYRQLLDGSRASESALLADEPPVPWRGRGDHGQGGEGMMGGTPYGRPMPMPDDDIRDGLMLDACTVRIGPFLSQLPAGLALEVTLQGDVLQHTEVLRPPLPPRSGDEELSFQSARDGPTVATLERARAAHHLRCIARVLVILQLGPLAERCRRAAAVIERGDELAFGRLRTLLRFSGAANAIPAGLGRLDAADAGALGGVALRAAGEAVDTRNDLPVYRKHGFRPLSQPEGDARARFRQWLAEAEQSLRLAACAGADRTELDGDVEIPWRRQPACGTPAILRYRLAGLLRGLEWQEAMLVINSFEYASLACMATPVTDDDSSTDTSGGDHP